MTSSVVGPRRSFKALPTAKLALKKGLVWWSAACLIHYSFLNLCETLHLRNTLSKLMRCTENGNTCSQQWSERAQFSTTMPDCTPHNRYFNSSKNWAIKLYLICHFRLISRQPTTTSSSIFTTFCRENASTIRRKQKMLRVHQIPKHWFLCLILKLLCFDFRDFKLDFNKGKQTFLVGKNVLTVMVPILINKDVFEPSYNDLKFTVWNHDYVCTNLIILEISRK